MAIDVFKKPRPLIKFKPQKDELFDIFPQSSGDRRRLSTRPFRVKVLSPAGLENDVPVEVVNTTINRKKGNGIVKHKTGDILSINKNTLSRRAPMQNRRS